MRIACIRDSYAFHVRFSCALGSSAAPAAAIPCLLYEGWNGLRQWEHSARNQIVVSGPGMGVRMEAVQTAVQPAVQTSAKNGVSATQLKICLIFATRGRAELLGKALAFVDMQTVKPDLIIVSCVTDEDVGALASRPGLLVIKGRPGLTAQRNHALNHVPDGFDVLIFLDDDFIMHRTWTAAVLEAFDSDPSIACVTGMTLADGINGPGYSFEEGQKILAETNDIPQTMIAASTGGPYGCNMAFRAPSVGGLRFDERLRRFRLPGR